MITIGSFTKADGGTFEGVIRTLTLDQAFVTIHPVGRTNDKAPDYRVSAGAVEVGAAWTVTREGKLGAASASVDGVATSATSYLLSPDVQAGRPRPSYRLG